MEVLAVGHFVPEGEMQAGVVVVRDVDEVLYGRVLVNREGGVFVEYGSLEDRRLRDEDEAWWGRMVAAVRKAIRSPRLCPPQPQPWEDWGKDAWRRPGVADVCRGRSGRFYWTATAAPKKRGMLNGDAATLKAAQAAADEALRTLGWFVPPSATGQP